MSNKKSLVGEIVLFIPASSKTFPYRLNGATELPAIALQEFENNLVNLSVFTPHDGVRTAWTVAHCQDEKRTQLGYDSWKQKDSGSMIEGVVDAVTQTRSKSGKFEKKKK